MTELPTFFSELPPIPRRTALGLVAGALGSALTHGICRAAPGSSATPCVELQNWFKAEQSQGSSAARALVQESLVQLSRDRGVSVSSSADVAAALGNSQQDVPLNPKIESAISNEIQGVFDPQDEALINKLKTWRRNERVFYEYVGRRDERCHVEMERAFRTWQTHCCVDFREGRNPTTNRGDIRISFVSGRGHYSNIGTDSREPRASANSSGFFESMNIDPTGAQGDYLTGVCLHELGHAIGLQHEHQNPRGGIAWNERAVIKRLASMGWDNEKIRRNVLNVLRGEQYRESAFDRDSIMMYWFSPEEVLTKGLVPETPNNRLSVTDIEFVRKIYDCGFSPVPPRAQPATATTPSFQSQLDEIRKIQSTIKRP